MLVMSFEIVQNSMLSLSLPLAVYGGGVLWK
jgi:hypothetical protein